MFHIYTPGKANFSDLYIQQVKSDVYTLQDVSDLYTW